MGLSAATEEERFLFSAVATVGKTVSRVGCWPGAFAPEGNQAGH